MRRMHTMGLAAALMLTATVAMAQETNASREAAKGADAGAQALGQVGAFVGGITGAAVGGAADIANAVTPPVPPTTVKRTTCITDAAGNKRCDSIETTQ